jgi:prepilin-type N-terminal cleavage/methylation domain-containing protein
VLKRIQEKNVCAETLRVFLIDSRNDFMKKQGIKPVLIQKASVKKAFTLTELLVSMAILGLISTLTLPNMFTSIDRAKKRAVFKEAFQALQAATYQIVLEGKTNYDVNNTFNTKKICPNSSLAEGCTTLDHHETKQAGVVLSTGVGLYGLYTGTDIIPLDGIIIALEEFPKKEYFYVMVNLASNNQSTSWIAGRTDLYLPSLGWTPVTPVIRPGELKCIEQKCLDMFNNT